MNSESITIDDLFDIFSSARRRCVWLYMMDTEGEEFSFEELADHVFLEMAGSRAEGRRNATGIGLRHIDLPKLADFGLIDYDPSSETVRCGDVDVGTLGETLVRLKP